MWYLYVLACGDGSLYTGITNDLARRVSEHESGRGARYTRAHLPVRLVAAWEYPDRGTATSAEMRFKRLRRAVKLRHIRRRCPFESSAYADDVITNIVGSSSTKEH